MSSSVWGATPVEWQTVSAWSIEDVLPVVSNPTAVISPNSKLRALGKTPSRYGRDQKVVGIPAWTDYRATDVDVGRWLREPDLGICMQTRLVRAIDIDIEDPEAARAVRECVEMLVGDLPVRYREGSGKCLLAFKLAGTHAKRIIRTERGVIEFLGNGQQFVAVGTHPKGERYQWQGGVPDDLPYLTADEFDTVWRALTTTFAVSSTDVRVPGKPLQVRDAEDAEGDEVLEFLQTKGHVHAFDGQGRAHITCPWHAEHTSGEPGDGSTTYFPAGVGGFAQGHFVCLHAHCADRTDGDYLEAFGYEAERFEVVPVSDHDLPLPPFERNRSGEILATVRNVEMAVRRSDVCGWHIGIDGFSDDVMLADHGTADWRTFTDADYVRLRIRLETMGFKSVGREMIRDVVCMVADDQRFDSAQIWLNGLRWDGIPRIEGFLTRYFDADDSRYTCSVSTYLWTALAGRVLAPGCKADMVPILVGEQGTRKSTGVAAMAPSEQHFLEVKFDEDEEKLARKMRGKLLGEIGELRGMASREIEHIKAFVTRTHEEWVPKYREFSVKFPRRLVFVGTTNADEFLADETGNRRWLPVRVGEVDLEAIHRDRSQLWAEAAARFTADGVCWSDAQSLAGDAHEEHSITDSWQEAIEIWLDQPSGLDAGSPPNRETRFGMNVVLSEALGMHLHQVTRREELRVGKVLRGLGFAKSSMLEGGRRVKRWWALGVLGGVEKGDEKGDEG
jgi:predicted P-loop ATPase